MSRVMISCLAELVEPEVQFLDNFREHLKLRGHDFVFLSPARYECLADVTIPLPGDWSAWTATYVLSRLPEALFRAVQEGPWLNRVQHVAGERRGFADCTRLLRSMAEAAFSILERVKPDVVVAWNPTDPSTGILHSIAHTIGIPVSAWERGFLPHTLNIDPQLAGISNSLSSIQGDPLTCLDGGEHSLEYVEQYLDRAFSASYVRYNSTQDADAIEALESSGRSMLRPRVLVLGCFDSACGISAVDSERIKILPGYASGFDLARWVSRSHGGATIFKPHPCEEARHELVDTRAESNLLLGRGNVARYFDWANVVVTYGSTLEYAALALGKPVVLAGRSSLYRKGIAYEALEATNLSAAIQQAYCRQEYDKRHSRFLAFVDFLLRDYLVQVASEADRRRGAERWCHHLESVALSGETKPDVAATRVAVLQEGVLWQWDINAAMKKQIARQQEQIAQQQEQLSAILTSRAWRLASKFHRLMNPILGAPAFRTPRSSNGKE